MSQETKKALQLVVGTVVVFFAALMFLRGTHLVGDAMSPTLPDGQLGAPPLAAVAVIEILISIIAAVGSFVLGGIGLAWNWIRGGRILPKRAAPRSSPGIGSPPGSARYIIAELEQPPGMSPAEARGWQGAMIQAAAEGDWQSTIRAAEKLHGKRFFPRQTKSENE